MQRSTFQLAHVRFTTHHKIDFGKLLDVDYLITLERKSVEQTNKDNNLIDWGRAILDLYTPQLFSQQVEF